MTKLLKSLALVGVLVPASAFAADQMIDTDGDGMYSFAELSASQPDLTEDEFADLDVNGDGFVDDVEYADLDSEGDVLDPGDDDDGSDDGNDADDATPEVDD